MNGISVYPEKSTTKEINEYLDLASKYNFKRVFTCLLSVTKSKEEILKEFKEVINHAKELNFHVILDVSPRVFEELEISYDDLSFFAKMNADGIRLDLGFDGNKESILTFNEYDLDIEINMSNDVFYVDNIMSYKPNKEKLLGSHNFYPQKYTGLNYDHFIKCSERFKKHNLRTAAFVTSQSAKVGPWEIMEGLCSLEMHRELPITTQVKHLYSLGLIDDIIIGNMFASEEELRKISEINPQKLSLEVEINKKTSELEEKIILEEPHFCRGDINDYLIRSTQSRVKYKQEGFKIHDADKTIKKGSIVIGNDKFGQYKGELQLVKKDITDDEGKRNIVGKVADHELFLIDSIKAFEKFDFRKK